MTSVLVSRCDRIGDLVLSLPVLGLLRDAGFSERILHCSDYAADVAHWAAHNGLCTEVWSGLTQPARSVEAALSLFHSPLTRALFRELPCFTLGPRTKISALWTYRRSVAQHRSRVEKSEMEYNLDLARALLRRLSLSIPPFQGLPALRLPTEWRSPHSPDIVVVVSNQGSAANWPLQNYLQLARSYLREGRKVDLLISGLDADERRAALRASGIFSEGAVEVGAFPRLRDLIAYLAAARLVVSSSTGPLHLAHAAGVEVLGIYPREPRVQSFRRWRPDGYWHAGALRFLEF